jgi:Spy/CpxP family protein refolding chaperone
MEQERPADQLAKPRRRWLRTVLLGTAIFVCGALVGGGLTFKIIASGYKRSFQEPAVLAEEITHRMKRRLDLTDDQVQQVRRIILEQQMAFQSLRKEFRPRLDNQIEKTRQELAAVLTPEQARKWEKRFAHIQRFWLPPLPGDSRDYSPSPKEK